MNQKRTKSTVLLENALLELIEKQPFDKLTVKKICEKAGLNRSTFYAHYSDIYEMLEATELKLYQELLVSYPVPDVSQPFLPESFIPFLQHIKKHKKFYRAILQSRINLYILYGYDGLLDKIIRPRLHASGIQDETEILYCFIYIQSGFTMLIKRWIEDDCTMDESQMARLFCNCLPSVF